MGGGGGALLAWVWGVQAGPLSQAGPPVRERCGRGPLPTGCGCGGSRRAWGPNTNPTARAFASWVCALWERHKGAREVAPLACTWGLWGWALSDSNHLSSGRAAGAGYPLGLGAGAVGVGTCHQPHSARTCELALRAVGAAGGRSGGGCLLPGCGASVVGRLQNPAAHPCAVRPGPAAHWQCVRGVWAWGPVINPTARALASCLCALWGGTRAPRGGPPFPGCGVSGLAGSPGQDRPFFEQSAGARYPRLQVRFAGMGARFSLAPSPVLRFVVCCGHFLGLRHPVADVSWHLSLCGGCGRRCASLACLVAPRWYAAPRPVRLLSVLRSAFPSLCCLPQPPVAVAPGYSGRLRGASGGRPRTGIIVPAAGPCRGRGAGLAPRLTCSGLRDGVVPGGSLGLGSWASCAAVVRSVWTRSLTCPFSRTVHLSTGD